MDDMPTYGTDKINGWKDFFKRFGSSPVKLNAEQQGAHGVSINCISIEDLYAVFKDRLDSEKCEHEFYAKSKWDRTFGRNISMCVKCGVLIGRER